MGKEKPTIRPAKLVSHPHPHRFLPHCLKFHYCYHAHIYFDVKVGYESVTIKVSQSLVKANTTFSEVQVVL